MNIFHSSKEKWRRQVQDTQAAYYYDTGDIANFPYAALRSATTEYLNARRGLLLRTPECDSRLNDLIEDHVNRGGSREIGILACVSAFTPSAAATVLNSLRDGPPDAAACHNYLRCIIFAATANTMLVSEKELQAFQCLAHLMASHENGARLFQSLILNLGELSYNYFLPAPYVSQVLAYSGWCTTFEAQVQKLRKARAFLRLYNSVSWLKCVPQLPHSSIPTAVLNDQLPSWQRWAAWSPNVSRISEWEGGSLSKEQKQKLRHIMDLEGPDKTAQVLPALKYSVPACFERILVCRPDPALPHRLLELLDDALAVKGTHAVDLFIHLCVSNKADEGDLDLAKTITTSEDDECCQCTLRVLQALAPSAGVNDRIVALRECLAGVAKYTILRDRFTDVVAEATVCAVEDAQVEYRRQLQAKGTAENFGVKLNAFGHTILGTDWLLERLPGPFVGMLQGFPTDEYVKDVFSHLKAVPATTDVAKAYLIATLGGNSEGRDTAALLAALQSRMRLYGNAANSARVGLALSIEGMKRIDAALVKKCQDQLLVEEQVLVEHLQRGLQMEPNQLCHEVARVLARRKKELSLPVKDCWVKLLRHLMVQQAASLVVWSSEKLTASAWFRWLQDMEVLFPGADPQYDHGELGITNEMRSWWDNLAGQYSRAVHKVESLQRGQGNLRWLFLNEVDHSDALLDLLSHEERLTYLHSSILAHFSADKQVVTNVCQMLSSLAHISPLVRVCLERLLDRHRASAVSASSPSSAKRRSSTSAWPVAALQVMHLGWERRLHKATPKEKVALQRLSMLVGTAPGWDQGGFTSASDLLTMEYRELFHAASKVEATRLALQLHNPKKTATLLSKLGIQDARGSADAAIPENLTDSIESVGSGAYELAFPLTQLRGYQRQIWGFPSGATMLLVRVAALSTQPTYCIHFYPNEEGPPEHRGFVVKDEKQPLPSGIYCTTPPTPFTYLLSRTLAKFLGSRHARFVDLPAFLGHKAPAKLTDLESIHGVVERLLACPGVQCMVCTADLRAKVWRPALCHLTRCHTELLTAPLESRVGSVLSDPPLLDFLLSCVLAAAQDPAYPLRLDLLPECPVSKDKLVEVINSFPPVVVGTEAHEPVGRLLSRIRQGEHATEREKLLSWMCASLGGCMLTAPQGSRVPLMPGVHQFLVASSSVDREARFSLKQQRFGAGTGTGGVAFHGAASSRLWMIMTQGLRNMSGTEFQVHGARGGPGVYLADEAVVAWEYCGQLGASWTHSTFSNRKVLLGCELQGHSPAQYHVVAEEDRVLVRYVFLCPENFTAPQTRLIDNAMKSTFASLRTGLF